MSICKEIKLNTFNISNNNLKTHDLFRSVGENFGNCLFHYAVNNFFCCTNC